MLCRLFHIENLNSIMGSSLNPRFKFCPVLVNFQSKFWNQSGFRQNPSWLSVKSYSLHCFHYFVFCSKPGIAWQYFFLFLPFFFSFFLLRSIPFLWNIFFTLPQNSLLCKYCHLLICFCESQKVWIMRLIARI